MPIYLEPSLQEEDENQIVKTWYFNQEGEQVKRLTNREVVTVEEDGELLITLVGREIEQ